MKRGDKVQVKDMEKVAPAFRGKIGTVTADSTVGDVIVAEFGDKAVTHAFFADELSEVVGNGHNSKPHKAQPRKSR
jgi:hypothetical protein